MSVAAEAAFKWFSASTGSSSDSTTGAGGVVENGQRPVTISSIDYPIRNVEGHPDTSLHLTSTSHSANKDDNTGGRSRSTFEHPLTPVSQPEEEDKKTTSGQLEQQEIEQSQAIVAHIPVAESKDQAPTSVPVIVSNPSSTSSTHDDSVPPPQAITTAEDNIEEQEQETEQPARRKPGRPAKERIRRIHLPVRPGMDQLSDSEGSGSEWGDPTEEDLLKLPPGYTGRRRVKKPTDGSIKPAYYYPTEGSTRGVPVFEPSYEEFKDFNAFINKIDNYGMRSGIVKVVPPKEWHQSLQSVSEPLKDTLIRDAIEQNFMGSSGLFKQSNIASRRLYNVKQWKELCESDKYATPDFFGVNKKNKRAKTENGEDNDEEDADSVQGDSTSARTSTRGRTAKRGDSSTATNTPSTTPKQQQQPLRGAALAKVNKRALNLMKARAAKRKRGVKGRPKKEVTPAASLSSELSSLDHDGEGEDAEMGEESMIQEQEERDDEDDNEIDNEARQNDQAQVQSVDDQENDMGDSEQAKSERRPEENEDAQQIATMQTESSPKELAEEQIDQQELSKTNDIQIEDEVLPSKSTADIATDLNQELSKTEVAETAHAHAPPTPAASTSNGTEQANSSLEMEGQTALTDPIAPADNVVDSKDKGNIVVQDANSVVAPANAVEGPTTPSKVKEEEKSLLQTDKSDAKTVNADASSKKRRRGREEAQDNWDEEWSKFDYASLPHGAKPEDYTIEECRKIEKHYWRNFTFGAPPMYGADGSGSLFDESNKEWNVAALDDLLMRINPHMSMPGVNTPYLYFGMWRATFSWHVEDADLYSINHLHFGAPKFWYSVPQAHAEHFERVMASYFQHDRQKCPEFLRHKSYLVSPGKLAKDGIPLNRVVQFPGEIVLTYPYGYHSGFNIGFNCAESINFATEGWLDIGRKAQACTCVSDSVRIDVDKWLEEAREDAEKIRSDPVYAEQRRQERQLAVVIPQHEAKRRRIMGPDYVERKPKGAPQPGKQPKAVKAREPTTKANNNKENIAKPASSKPAQQQQSAPVQASAALSLPQHSSGPSAPVLGLNHGTAFNMPSIPMLPSISNSKAVSNKEISAMATVKPAKAAKPVREAFPCALCPEQSTEGLVRVKLVGNKPKNRTLYAHRICVTCTPTTYVAPDPETGEEVVYGFDRIEPARWNLKCGLCPERHGTKIQCTKSHKCVRAFHATCALKEDSGVVLDAVVGGRSVLNPTDDVQQAPAASDDGHLSILVACRQHNPAWMQALIEKRKLELSERVATTPVGTQIQIRATTGIYSVTILGHRPEQAAVEIAFGDGTRALCKHGAIVWPEEAVKLQPKPKAPKKPKQASSQPRPTPTDRSRPVQAVGPSQPPMQQFSNGQQQYTQPWNTNSPQQFNPALGYHGQMTGQIGQHQPSYQASVAQHSYQMQPTYPSQQLAPQQGQPYTQQHSPVYSPSAVQSQQSQYLQQYTQPGNYHYPVQNQTFQQPQQQPQPHVTPATYPQAQKQVSRPLQNAANTLPPGFVPQPIPYYNGKGMPYK